MRKFNSKFNQVNIVKVLYIIFVHCLPTLLPYCSQFNSSLGQRRSNSLPTIGHSEAKLWDKQKFKFKSVKEVFENITAPVVKLVNELFTTEVLKLELLAIYLNVLRLLTMDSERLQVYISMNETLECSRQARSPKFLEKRKE